MEDILASIKRIIAEDGAAVPPPTPRRGRVNGARAVSVEPAAEPVAEDGGGEVLELTHSLDSAPASREEEPLAEPTPRAEARAASVEPAAQREAAPAPVEIDEPSAPLVSHAAADASRHAIAALSAAKTRPVPAGETSLEGLVREMLRPMLAAWLDEHLPAIVDRTVQREIARIAADAE